MGLFGDRNALSVKRDTVGKLPQKIIVIRPLLSCCEIGRMSTHDLNVDVDVDRIDQHIPCPRGRVMQVFQRGVNESLVIGPDVVITVLDIQSHCVRIAVQNPAASPSYYEETLFLDGGDDDCDPEASTIACFEDELELSGSHTSGW